MSERIPVLLDFMQANQLIAACEQREAFFEHHLANGRDAAIEAALVETIAAELAIRAAFRLSKSEALLDALHEATIADLEDLSAGETFDPAEGSFDPPRDIPKALDTYWNGSR